MEKTEAFVNSLRSRGMEWIVYFVLFYIYTLRIGLFFYMIWLYFLKFYVKKPLIY